MFLSTAANRAPPHSPNSNSLPWLPTSGGEPEYNEGMWNGDSVRSTHNCYAYFLQDVEGTRRDFPQPGAYADARQNAKIEPKKSNNPDFKRELPTQNEAPPRESSGSTTLEVSRSPPSVEFRVREPYTCSSLRRAILADNPDVIVVDAQQTCPTTHYKAYVAVDPRRNGDGDYHFWIQNSGGLWSHKPGSHTVARTDEDGNFIVNPHTSNRGRYTISCQFYCVPSNSFEPTNSDS